MLSFVQFPHPGKEHGPDKGQQTMEKGWNRGPHRRKFMLSSGDYVNQQDQLVENVDLLFWGEWEPPSNVKKIDSQPLPHHPRWLHTPFLPRVLPRAKATTSCLPSKPSTKSGCIPTCVGGLQNTDPYVFDGAFKYLVCRQGTHRGTKPTALAKLDRGSLILFGSAAGTGPEAFFQLDTVFVVDDYVVYDPSDWAKTLKTPQVISTHYHDVVVQHAFRTNHPSIEYRLYRGATYNNPVEGMYSFVPARICEGTATGFPRVKIHGRDLPAPAEIGAKRSLQTDNLRQAARCTALIDIAAAAKIWHVVREITRRQGTLEAVWFSHPKRL